MLAAVLRQASPRSFGRTVQVTLSERFLRSKAGSAYQQELMKREKLFVVDEFDNVLSVAPKLECHYTKGSALPPLHRAFSMFHFCVPTDGSSKGSRRLLITQRAPTKLLFPQFWSNTCCSHPTTQDIITDKHTITDYKSPNENINGSIAVTKRAAKRKMFDELGMVVSTTDMIFVGKYQYSALSHHDDHGAKWAENEVDYVLISSSNASFECNPEETMAAKWVTKHEIEKMLESRGALFTPWLRLLTKRHLWEWWDALENDALTETSSPVVHNLN